MGDGTVDRRRFIGLGLAAAGSAATNLQTDGRGAAWTTRARLSWESVLGFPGRPNALVLEAPDLPDGAEVEVIVSVHGPDMSAPVVELLSAIVRVEGGSARTEATLTYPYAARVAGDYRYEARACWRGAALCAVEPATYAVRAWLPLS